ncbi:enamine deaminase RidA (YjgF/YER057c/UK114 family) [Lipingzhangella halophila]|uniref:Enamine deaminase RidA (YjgF/YER057c/UK114 family) n=1 Tax=Lipingzhangella halophila TaxID=1783352 RepID=A0A7W7W2H0_9ACTN|nr:Rid family hydrolase [Lipingzhangella halophila]MBB4931756.1 enamine deaminase RidA (YjgF/YER057c/UK114 family) [Lipingzhangella halophila]
MPHTILNPDTLHDPTPFGYSHIAATRGDLVVIAGQYACDDSGRVLDADFDTQVEVAFDRLGTALSAVGLDYSHVVRLGTYIVDHDESTLMVVGRHIARHWGTKPPTQTLLGVAGLALPGMRFEVDALAVRP